MRKKRTWLVILLIGLAAGTGYGAYSMLLKDGSNHITVSEAKAQAESLSGQKVRVAGRVDPSSIQWGSQERIIRFALTDQGGVLDVFYRGVVPDDFTPGANLVVEGRFGPGGEFEVLNFPSRSLCNICH